MKSIFELMDITHTLELLCIERGRDMSPLWLGLWVGRIGPRKCIMAVAMGSKYSSYYSYFKWLSDLLLDEPLQVGWYCHS